MLSHSVEAWYNGRRISTLRPKNYDGKKYGKEDLVWIIRHGDGILHI